MPCHQARKHARESFATLQVRRYQPKERQQHHGTMIVEKLYMKLQPRGTRGKAVRGRFSPVPVVKNERGEKTVLPIDRARAWEELVSWILYHLVFQDPCVRQHQYLNRVAWESWDSSEKNRPQKDDLYDWRNDDETLARLRPRYRFIYSKFQSLIGNPSMQGVAARYPNEFEDIGLSDRTRRVVRDFKLLFGDEIFVDIA